MDFFGIGGGEWGEKIGHRGTEEAWGVNSQGKKNCRRVRRERQKIQHREHREKPEHAEKAGETLRASQDDDVRLVGAAKTHALQIQRQLQRLALPLRGTAATTSTSL